MDPKDGQLHEDRPLLKHRASVGFSARRAKDAASSTASCVQKMAKNGRAASRKLRRRAQDLASRIPTPTRNSRPAAKNTGFYEFSEDAESRYENDSIFSIGSDDEICSDDEEEHIWATHPLEASPGPLDEALSTWGRPGDTWDDDESLGRMEAVKPLNFGNIQVESKVKTCQKFYMGTPRTDML